MACLPWFGRYAGFGTKGRAMDMKYGKTTARRLLSALLALVMCLGMLPGTALADDGAARPRGKLMAVPRASEPDAERQPQDWVVPLGLWGEYDEVTVYRRISQQAKDFISCVQTMEGALNEVHKMLQRVSELTAKASNGTNADVDLDAYCREIANHRSEITRIAETAQFDGWYGLSGGSAWFQSTWEEESVGKLLYCETFDLREVSKALEVLDGLIRRRDPVAADLVNAQIDRVSTQRSELGACQNMAEHIIKWADCCDVNVVANYPLTELDVGSLTGLGEANHAFPATEDERILTSTRNNALKAIAAVQLCEGALREIHDMFQRQNELAVQATNGTYTDSDVASIRTEVDRLNLGIRYILAATCIDGYHMMDRDGVLTVPVGWAELCHSKAEIKFTDFEDMLVDPAKFGDAAAPDAVKEVIDAVSAQRSEFGTWQNGMEHVVSFCDYVLDNGPMVGNEFSKDEDGSHVLEHIEGAFKAEVASILSRQDELRVQIGNDTLTDFDRQSIQLELDRLDDVLDILVDLVYVRTAGVVQVQEDGESDWHRDLVLDETGARYNYKLRYASQHTDVTNVSVVDYLENADNSVWAGVLTGIELPEDIDPGQMEVYVMLDGFDSVHNSPGHEHTTLPDGNWTKVEDLDSFKDWDRVYGVGVYFGDTVFGPELGEGRIGADVILHMKLSLGAKANSVVRAMPAGGYVLTNSVTTCENSADAAGAVRTASETYTTVLQPASEENTISVGSSVINQVWTDPDTVPTGPEDSPNWGSDYDAPIGSDLYYRTIINFNAMTGQGVLSELGGSSILKSRMVIQHDVTAMNGAGSQNLVLSCLLDRVTPDYETLKVWQDGKELVAGKDYRLYTSGFHMYSDDHGPANAKDISALMALRDRIQLSWCPYYTFGLIFSNDLMPKISVLGQENQGNQGILDLLKGRAVEQAGDNAAGNAPQYGSDSIVITYKAKLDTNAFLVGDDGAGHSIEASGMPVRLVTQCNTATLGYSAMEKSDFEALIGGAGSNELPRFAGAENIDVAAIEKSGNLPGLDNVTENTQDAESDIRDTDMANGNKRMVIQHNISARRLISGTARVYNYGFDIAKLDEENKLLHGAVFEVRTGPEDDAPAMEFVRVRLAGQDGWMDGSSREDVFPEGPVYRLAVGEDPKDVRTTEIEAGKAIVVGLDSGTYYVTEKKAPAGHIRDYGQHSVKLLSLADFMAENLQQAGQSMLAQANQSNQDVLAPLDGISQDGDSSTDSKVSEKIQYQIRGHQAAWKNMIPIQVDGTGVYDLSHIGLKEKCVSAMAYFDRNEDGEYVYGNTSLVLQVGAEVGQTIQGSIENPLKGGLPVVNEPGSEFELPKTGGTGTGAYIAIGSMMALLSGLLLVDRKKRR